MDKHLIYSDAAASDKLFAKLHQLAINTIANRVVNYLPDESLVKLMPSALIVNESLKLVQQSIDDNKDAIPQVTDKVHTLINPGNPSAITDFQNYASNEELNMYSQIDNIDQKIIKFPEYELNMFIVEYDYTEIENPINRSIYIYKNHNKYGLGYYDNNQWYISSMLIPGINDLIRKDELIWGNETQIIQKVDDGYNQA